MPSGAVAPGSTEHDSASSMSSSSSSASPVSSPSSSPSVMSTSTSMSTSSSMLNSALSWAAHASRSPPVAKKWPSQKIAAPVVSHSSLHSCTTWSVHVVYSACWHSIWQSMFATASHELSHEVMHTGMHSVSVVVVQPASQCAEQHADADSVHWPSASHELLAVAWQSAMQNAEHSIVESVVHCSAQLSLQVSVHSTSEVRVHCGAH